MSSRGRRSMPNKFVPQPLNKARLTLTPRQAQPPPLNPADGMMNVVPAAPLPPNDFRDEAIRRFQEKYDADAKVLAEKRRLKRLEELERILPTAMEGRILASGEAGCAIYAKQQQQSGQGAGAWMSPSTREKEEQRMKSVRQLEKKYEQDAKMEAEKLKLLEEKKRAAKELEKLTKAMEGQSLGNVNVKDCGRNDKEDNENKSYQLQPGMPRDSEEALKRRRKEALRRFEEKYEHDAKRAKKSDEKSVEEKKRARLAELEKLVKHGRVLDVKFETTAVDGAGTSQ